MNKKTIFSGIQPSGNLHIGNYLGAIQNWVALQNKYQSIFCVVDLHAITVLQKPEELREKSIEVAKIYLAAGIDPKKSKIFIQSQIPEHTELMWILNTLTKTGELFKMTQFKDKAGLQDGDYSKMNSIDAGLMNYPVLMAADILLYNANVIPVGEDQVQHVELARDLGKRFNNRFGEAFIIPKVEIKKEGKRIMGLDDPLKKMSKSADSKYNRIDVLDSPDEIREKIKKSVTDAEMGISYDDNRPAVKNLINIFALTTNLRPKKIVEDFKGKGFKEFKETLAEAVVEFLKPFQKRFHELSDNEVLMILEESRKKLAPMAKKKMDEVKKKVGFVSMN